MSYKSILFDWGGVLAPGGTPDEMPGRLSQATQMSPDELRPILKELAWLLKTGQITIDGFWERFEQTTGKVVPVSQRDIWAKIDELRPSQLLRDYTEELKAAGYIVGILSNTFPNTADEIAAEGLYEPYSPVLLSSTEGMAKPNEDFYLLALERLDSTPEEVIFIDDQEKCLAPAREMGIKTILAQSPEQIVADLNKLLGRK